MGTKDFYACANNGGRIKTKRLKNGKIIKICYDKDGTSHVKVVKKRDKTVSKQQSQKKTEVKSKQELATEESIRELKKHFDTQMGR